MRISRREISARALFSEIIQLLEENIILKSKLEKRHVLNEMTQDEFLSDL